MSGQVIPIVSPPPRKEFPFTVELLDEPFLQFAEGGWALDPRVGLKEYGPRGRSLDLHPAQVGVGFVGTGKTIDAAKVWFDRCSRPILSSNERLRQTPAFPGFNEASSFAT